AVGSVRLNTRGKTWLIRRHPRVASVPASMAASRAARRSRRRPCGAARPWPAAGRGSPWPSRARAPASRQDRPTATAPCLDLAPAWWVRYRPALPGVDAARVELFADQPELLV